MELRMFLFVKPDSREGKRKRRKEEKRMRIEKFPNGIFALAQQRCSCWK